MNRVHKFVAALPFFLNGFNAHAEFLARRYDEAAYLTTHHSACSQDAGCIPPSQDFNIVRQLNDGVRAFMLEIHPFKKTTYVCYNRCEFGNVSTFSVLYTLSEFLRSHPSEVVTLFLDERVEPQLLQKTFFESGLLDFVHAQSVSEPWPKLSDLVAARKTFVVFSQHDYQDAYPWLHPLHRFASIEDVDCNTQAGREQKPLMLVVNAITNPYSLKLYARKLNKNPAFEERIANCSRVANQIPNFIIVDFYQIGDALAVVNKRNVD